MTIAAVLCSMVCSQVVIGPPLYYDIKFCGRIESKYYVKAVLPRSRTIEVPIVNGFAPIITIDYKTYGEVRTFCYDESVIYKGGVINYVTADFKDCECLPLEPIVRSRPRSIPNLEPIIPKVPPVPKSVVLPPLVPKSVIVPKPKKSIPKLTEASPQNSMDKRPFLSTFEDEVQETKPFPRY